MRLPLSLLVLLAALLAPSDAQAAKFVASLTSLRVNAGPGDISTHAYPLTLDKGELPTKFKFRLEDWWRSEDGLQSFYAQPGTLTRSCANWVSVNPVEAVVQPGETLMTRLTISVPTDASAGGYWCVLTVDEVPDPLRAPNGVGAMFVASVSTGVFIYLEPVKRSVEFTDVQVEAMHAVLAMRNDGNAPVGVEGRVEFFRPVDLAIVAALSIPRVTLLTEPVTRATVRVPLPSPSTLPSGRYLVRAIIDIGLDHYIGVEQELQVSRQIAATTSP